METLILCVDRDNDFGEKAKIKSPIIGRQANLDAAVALGLSDPEDSDTNTIFAAIKVYDELLIEGKDVEIVTICGDTSVGRKSDELITKQLNEVLKQLTPKSVIFVSDGAEDDFILPIVSSRIKIDRKINVMIKQSEKIESVFYFILRSFGDRKLALTFILPLSLMILALGISAVYERLIQGIGVVSIILGSYLLIRVAHLEGSLQEMGREIYSGMTAGKITWIAIICALFIGVWGLLAGIESIHEIDWKWLAQKRTGESADKVSPQDIQIELKIVYSILVFIGTLIWYLIFALLIKSIGKYIGAYYERKEIPWKFSILPFSLFSIGLIVTGIVEVLQNILENTLPLNRKIFLCFVAGFFIFFVGKYFYDYFEKTYAPKPQETLDWQR